MDTKIYKSIPFVKGQVWLVDEPYEVTQAKLKYGTCVQCKTRPYVLYLSNDDAQLQFNVVQGFPISSNDKLNMTSQVTGHRTFYDFDIRFTNQFREINRIITGQLQTLDTRYLRKYLYTLPDEVMQEIDELMIRRFGLGGALAKMSKRVTEFEQKIEELKCEGMKIYNNFIGPMVDPEAPAQQTEAELVKPPVNNPCPQPEPEQLTPPVELPKEEDKPSESAPQNASGEVAETIAPSRTPAGKIRWNLPTMKQFLDDYELYGVEGTATRWGLSRSQAISRKNYCSNKIAGKPLRGKRHTT